MPAERTSQDARFPTTRASAVRGAASGDAAVRERALEALVRVYWKPAYKHVRVRWRASREDAEDLVQGFFALAVDRAFFDGFEEGRARFRTFFRVCLDRYASNEAKARSRKKRGGDGAPALDFDAAEQQLARAGVAAGESPEECFDREWRRSVFALAVQTLRSECEAKGKTTAFAVFERYDLADPAARPSYDDVGKALGVTTPTVTNHLAYARRELRRIVLAELEEITAGAGELRDESRELFSGAQR